LRRRAAHVAQKRRFDRLPFTSGRSPSTDIVGVRRHVANVLLAEVMLAAAKLYLALNRFAVGIVWHYIDREGPRRARQVMITISGVSGT
jgi:hypothetical protein